MNVGDVLAGKYTVERVLGSGEMGVVVAARHHELDELRAIKVLHRDLLGDGAMVARFLAGVRGVARLKSEHIVRVYDTGRLEDETPYIVMEHLEGEDLAGVLRRSGTLPVQEAVLCILQVCDAVAEARAQGIAHRALRPTNLFVVRRPSGLPCIKILDFGLVKKTDRRDPAYLAPEQIRAAQEEDARTEVWTLAVILYELLTGRRPFVADEAFEIVAKILEQKPEPPSALRRDLPPELDAILVLCLQKDPEQRMQSVEALHYALAPFGPLPAVADALPSRRTVARERALSAPALAAAAVTPAAVLSLESPAAAPLSEPPAAPLPLEPPAAAPPYEPPAELPFELVHSVHAAAKLPSEPAPPVHPAAAPPFEPAPSVHPAAAPPFEPAPSVPPAAALPFEPAPSPSSPPAAALPSTPPPALPSTPPPAVPSVPPPAVPSVPPPALPSFPPPAVPSVPPPVPSFPPPAVPSVPPPSSERAHHGEAFEPDDDASENDLPIQGRGLGTPLIVGLLVAAAVAIGILVWSRGGDSGPSSPSASALPAVSASASSSLGKPTPPPAESAHGARENVAAGVDARAPRAVEDAGSAASTTPRDAGADASTTDAGAARPRRGAAPTPTEVDPYGTAPSPPAQPEKATDDPY